MTPFKERMNLYRAYRELNPDKNYWDWKASIDNAGKLAQQFRTRTNKPNFVQRLEDPNRQTIPSWEDDTSVATHRLSYATYDDGSAVIYPEVQQIGNELYDFTDPANRQTRRDAYQSALNRGDFVWVSTEQDAVDFTTQYKNHYPTFSKGSPEVPAMQGGGNTEDYQSTSEIPIYWDEESQSFKRDAPRVIGLLNTPIADMFNPANDVYDVVQVGKDATEGNWAGVGAGLVLAAMPKWMEKVGGVAKSGVKKLINKVRRSDNVDLDEIVSGLAVPIKKDPISPDAMPTSDKIKFDDTHVAGLSGQTSPRYLDYGTVEFLDHIGYTRPQWIRDVLEFYNKDVAAREREFATNQGILYTKPNLLNRADITFSENHPVEVRLYLDDVAFGGYANKKRIVLTRGTKLPADLALVHEGTHIDLFNIDELLVPTTEHRFHDIDGHILVAEYPVPELENVLNRAYTFTDDFLERHPDVHEMFEAGASNREMRYLLWKEHGKPNAEELDKIIDNMSDDDIRYLLTQANAYTRNFNKFITEDAALSGLDPHYYVEAIKQALKYVPALAAPVMIHNTEDKSN